MHELSIIAGLFEILEEKAREQGAVRVTAVTLRVGRLSGVVPELLVSAFDAYKKGTLAEEAGLEVETAPFDLRCRSCGGGDVREAPAVACASCGSGDVELLGGMDIVVERIEVEVPDPAPPASSTRQGRRRSA